jgi:hypothetical protein
LPADAFENFGRTLGNRVELDWSNLPRFVCFCCTLDRADGPAAAMAISEEPVMGFAGRSVIVQKAETSA